MASDILEDTSEAAIFSRVLETDGSMFSHEAARVILALDFSNADRERINELSAKASAGTLSPEEDQALENFIRVGDLLAILQSKARQSLRRGSSPEA